jgi:hypothetical protein
LNSGFFSDIFQNFLPLAAQNGEIVSIEAEHFRFKLHPLGHAPLAEQLSLNNDRVGQFHRRPVQENHVRPVLSQDNADFMGQAGLQGRRGLADQQGDVVVALRAGGAVGLGAEEVGEKNLALACKVSLEGFYIGISMPI